MENNNQNKTYTILELNSEIRNILWEKFPQLVWLRGEVIGFDKQKQARNIFFQLQEKDPEKDQIISKISATIFSSDVSKILDKFNQVSQLRDGLEVKVLCRVDVYPPWGEYKVIIKDIDPQFTLGKLAQSREAIIQYLEEKGLLDKNKETTLSLLPQKIGLISQSESEGFNDFISELKKSKFYFKIHFYNTAVQGEKVEREVCQALDYFNQTGEVEAIVIVRGGGSKTDLSWFDNKKIAEKIALSSIPVITGIGHKTDFSITDLVAFSYQQTPSIAATFFVERVKDFLDKITDLSTEIIYNSQRVAGLELQGLKEIKEQINRESLVLLREDKNNLLKSSDNLFNYSKEFLEKVKEVVKEYSVRLSLLDPVNLLRLGFSLSKINGKVIKKVNEVKVGDKMITIVSDGEIKSIIK